MRRLSAIWEWRQLAAYKLLAIDELGYVPLSHTGAGLLFGVFSQRYERDLLPLHKREIPVGKRPRR